MKSMAKITLLILVLAMCAGLYAEPVKFVRFPHFCKDMITFTYHGDIWVANADGTHPHRLTVHVARDVFPRFSPDGQWIAFSSNRMGNNDVWVISVTGGEPRQLTFHTTNDSMLYWTPDGQNVIFATSRKGTFYSPLYQVSMEGGLPTPLDVDFGAAGMMSQDGKLLAYNRMGFRYWRKHYRGNYNTDIWVRDSDAGTFTQLTDRDTKQFRTHTQDAFPMWGQDGMIYFMSERDDIFNIWKIAPGGGEPAQVTFHEKDGIQYPSISPDGKTIVYENEFELWRLDVPDGQPRRISVSMDFDLKENLVQYLHVDSEVDDFAPSPDGTNLVVDNHGEIFVVPTDPEIGEKTQITASPWRDRSAEYSPDGKYVCFISDESGDDELWLYTVASGERRKLTSHESQKRAYLWAPDSKRIVFVAANRLFMIVLPDGEVTELAYNQARGFLLWDFSQDGKWISYTRQDDASNTDVYLFDIAAKKEYNVSQNPFRDNIAEFTPDDGKLVFVSTRDNGVGHLFVLPLEKQKEDPDDPLVKARIKRDLAAKKGDKEKADTAALKLDMNRIDRRAVQLTQGENPVGSFFLSKDGKTVFYTSRDDKGPGLFSIGIDGKDQKKVTDGDFRGLKVSADGKTVFFLKQNVVQMMPLASKKPKKVGFDLVVTVDVRKEWEQIFEESWRVMKYIFYDENMHGYDWDAIKAVYKPFLKYVGENQDLYDLTNEMIGELNASHTGVSGPTQERPETYRTQFPGFELEPADDYYRVSHVYWNGPADREWIDLKVGDYVLAVDGRELQAGDNFWELFNHTLNEYVTLHVNNKPEMTGAYDVRIKTVASLRNIKYEEWVKQNRDYVEELTNKEIAYVHIRSMNRSSLQKFENEIDQFTNRKGIIVDIRYNGGGNIDQQLLDILERRAFEYWNNRWSSRAQGRRPRQAIVGPKVMLINWRSASDSEVTPMGFRDLGLGRIVGTPTYGAVIATGSYRLINGGRIRTPGSLVVTYDPSKPNNYGVNLENYGVAPDVWVENTPEDEITGFDRELKAAVDEVLRMLKEGKWTYK